MCGEYNFHYYFTVLLRVCLLLIEKFTIYP